MDLHFVGTANVFVYYPYWKKARSAPADHVHGSGCVNRSMAYSLCNRIALAAIDPVARRRRQAKR